MNPMKKIFIMIGLSAVGILSYGQTRQRNEIPEKYQWDLTHIFASDEHWKTEKDKISPRIAKIADFKGKLTQTPQGLALALEFISDLRKDLTQLYAYASMKSDQDTRVSTYAAMKLELNQLFTQFSTASSFVEPELLKVDESILISFLEVEPKLEPFSMYLRDLLRKKKHRGSADVEAVIAQASLMSGTASNINSTFYNADFPHASLEIEGKTVKLTPANFTLYRANTDRATRKKVFETYFNRLHDFQRTFGAQLYGQLNRDLFYSKVRNYNSTLEAALDPGNIPIAVYHNLIKNVNDNLSTFHRYLLLRKRMLGLNQLHYYDLYAPLVADIELSYDVPTAEKHILASLKPLGQEYVDVVEYAFANRWIDMYPNDGKRSGAYSNGSAYDVHPYILMNYNGKYDDVSTLTHELGHAMHSYLTNQNQHFANSNYSIFVAEVASTVNEALLNDHFLQTIKDDAIRLSILGNYLEGAKGTLFRQTQFAEFELLIHQLVEQGQALTGDDFDKLYLELTRKYYGHDQGICIVDDFIRAEWSYIPHFYYNYYVYQYATSFTASQAIAEQLINKTPGALEKYLHFLASGSIKYPVDLLIDAGVDMTTNEPFLLTIAKMNAVMDEIDQILDKMGK